MYDNMTCPSCGQIVPTAKFCVRCGSPLPDPFPPHGCIVEDDPWAVAEAEGSGQHWLESEDAASQAAEEEARRQREAEEASRKVEEEVHRRQLEKEAARKRLEAERRQQRAYQEAATSERNALNKLVFLTREEARTGCTKDIELEPGRVVSVNIPAGVNSNSHVEIPGEGRIDSTFGVRGILRLSFMITD